MNSCIVNKVDVIK